MTCGRGSRPGAAAVAGLQLHLLVLVLFLFLFSVMPHRAFSQELALPGKSHQEWKPNITCTSVPYAFGAARGSSLPGFEVTCGQHNESMLQIGERSYKIDHVSLEGGFVVIFAPPIRQVCYDRHGKPGHATGISSISLEMTPFSFSKRNKLVATGCNYLLAANFTDLSSQHNTTSCSPVCDGSTNAVDCPDSVACCETHIPMDAAQKFTLKFEKTSGQITGEKGTCSTAFFLDQDDPDFRSGTAGGQRPLKDLLLPAGDRRMVLDWAIGSGTCDQASTYSLAPLSCSSMSGCIDAPRGAGYLCKCNAGYGGNPYTANGCADINECQNNKNDCSYPELCSNTEGGFTCSCPHNFIGDGHRKVQAAIVHQA